MHGLGWVAQSVEHCPVHQKFVDLIPTQGTYLGGGFKPWLGVYGRQLIDVSLSHQCLSLSLSSFSFYRSL